MCWWDNYLFCHSIVYIWHVNWPKSWPLLMMPIIFLNLRLKILTTKSFLSQGDWPANKFSLKAGQFGLHLKAIKRSGFPKSLSWWHLVTFFHIFRPTSKRWWQYYHLPCIACKTIIHNSISQKLSVDSDLVHYLFRFNSGIHISQKRLNTCLHFKRWS